MDNITVISFVTTLANYFRCLNYHIPLTFEKNIFELYASAIADENDQVFNEKNLKELAPIFKTMICQNIKEYGTFDEHYTILIENLEAISTGESSILKDMQKMQKTINDFEKDSARLEQYQKELKSLKHQHKTISKSLQDSQDFGIPEKTLKKYEELFAKIRSHYNAIRRKVQADENLSKFPEIVKKKDFKKVPRKDKLSKILDEVLKVKDAQIQADLLKYIQWQISVIEKMEKIKETREAQKTLEQHKTQLEKNIKYQEDTVKKWEERVGRKQGMIPVIKKLIVKEDSKTHREEFLEYGRAVQSAYTGDIKDVECTPFERLSIDDKKKIKGFIKRNTLSMKTRLIRNLRTKQKKTIDIKETCKAACNTNGIPLKLLYSKPKKEQAKLVLFLDISGSCKNASEMLMNFMYEMRKAFPGGCKNYVFVNTLYDASEFFNENSAEKATESVFSKVPTRGVYSDYNTPLKQYCKNNLSEVDRNTIIIFMGDARNNENPTGEDYMKKISEKARKTYFLNTETMDRWNVNDSIISTYARYMNKTLEVTTPKQLINFMSQIQG